MKTTKPKRLGERIADSLIELRDAVRSGRPLAEQFTVRTIEIADPRTYTAKDIRRLRNRLAVSQGVFARLVGVSVSLVEHWEQGVVGPRPLARRLMDEIARDPAGFLARQLGQSGKPARVAG